MKKGKKIILRYGLLIFWMAFIFFMSQQPGDLSSEYSNFVVKVFTLLGLNFDNYFGELATFIVRKGAHFTEYFILFILVYRVIILYTNNKKAAIYSIIFVFLYACSDEFHQSFVPGRGPAFRDVMIDTSGGVVSCIVLGIINKLKKPKSKK